MDTTKDINISINLNLRNDLEKFIKNKLSKEELNKLGVFPQDEQLERIKNESLDNLITIYNGLQNRLLHGNKKVILCDSLLKNKLYPTYNKIIYEFKDKLENGESITNYLSNRIDNLYFKDRLLQDWNIHHLHFVPRNQDRNNSNDILFLMDDEDKIYFINIMSHDDFENIDLLKYIYKQNPMILEKYRLNGIPQAMQISPDDIRKLRYENVDYCISFSENTYAPSINPKSEFYLVSSLMNLHYSLKEYEKYYKEFLKQYVPAYYNSINFNWIIDNKLNELKFSPNNFGKIIRIAYDDNRNIGINNMLHELKII